MFLPDRIRLPLTFDPAALARDLAQIYEIDWIAHFVDQNYEGDWSAIPLRAPAGESNPIRQIVCMPDAKAYEETAYLRAAPYFQEVVATFRCPLLNVRLMRLTPGSRIKPHRDGDLDPQSGLARLHIPIATNPAVEFCLAGRNVVMAPGECWSLRLCEEHSAYNGGTQDRVHIVLDAHTDDWLMARLEAGARAAAEPTV